MQQDTERIGQLCGCVFDSVEGGDYKWTIFKKSGQYEMILKGEKEREASDAKIILYCT